jgi:hypothetical protein
MFLFTMYVREPVVAGPHAILAADLISELLAERFGTNGFRLKDASGGWLAECRKSYVGVDASGAREHRSARAID